MAASATIDINGTNGSTVSECLPVLDFSDADRHSKARQIIEVMETVGFMFLEKVPGYSEDDLRWCQEFFFDVMPPEKKLQVARMMYNPDSKNVSQRRVWP